MTSSLGPDRLREYLRHHNRMVLGLSALTFAATVILWGALCFVTWWMYVLAGTATKPLDFQPHAGPVIRGFLMSVVLLCLVAWIANMIRPNQMPRDRKTFWEHCLDLVFAVPRLTLASIGMGGAVARLSDSEMEEAWGLLQRLEEAGKPLPVESLPVEMPEGPVRKKILVALQLAGIIEIRTTRTGRVVAFHSEEARSLAQGRVQFRV